MQIDIWTILTDLITASIIGLTVFVFTNSKIGGRIISDLKRKLSDIDIDIKKNKELAEEENGIKKLSSKIYDTPKSFDVSTWFTCKLDDLDIYEYLLFSISDPVDGKLVRFKIDTKIIKKSIPEEYLETRKNDILNVYIRRKRGTKDFVITRLGKVVDAININKYLVQES